MAPFDGPALAAAKLRVDQLNAKGGVNGRKLEIRTCDTQGNKPDVAKACALRLLDGKANVIFTTCDVDLAASPPASFDGLFTGEPATLARTLTLAEAGRLPSDLELIPRRPAPVLGITGTGVRATI